MPSRSTRITGFLRRLPDLAPTDVITTIGSPVSRRVLASCPSLASNFSTCSRTQPALLGTYSPWSVMTPQHHSGGEDSGLTSVRAMSAIDGVSEIFDPAEWDDVPGFEDLTDLTYHRARAHGTVRIAFDRPDVLNAFRPHTVDELLRVLEHARTTSDVGCVLLTGNGPSEKNGKWAFCTGGDQRIRGRAGYMYENQPAAEGETADVSVDKARLGRLHILECQRLIRFMPK